MLYCILFLHQTTTEYCKSASLRCCIASSFYIKPQLDANGNPTDQRCIASSFYIKPQRRRAAHRRVPRCIASSFYIKPQLEILEKLRNYGCIASSFYIKPQRQGDQNDRLSVVLHPLSTSNHNIGSKTRIVLLLYCILFLHQTTTRFSVRSALLALYCILFLHQTTTMHGHTRLTTALYCILFLHQTTTSDARHFDFRALNSQ